MNSTAIALLTLRPDKKQLDFFNGFNKLGYDVFVIVDDNSFFSKHPETKIVQIDDTQCIEGGFKHLNLAITITKGSPCSAWEKALYFFTNVENSHKFVWLIEDDVFVPSHRTLAQIDAKYDHDIVSTLVFFDAELSDWWPWWATVPSEILAPPWGRGMVCAIRLSVAMLKEIGEFLRINRGFEPSSAIS
jgi:hypothetical protein